MVLIYKTVLTWKEQSVTSSAGPTDMASIARSVKPHLFSNLTINIFR